MVDNTGEYETTDDGVEYDDDGVDYPEDEETPDYAEEDAVTEDDSDGATSALLWFSAAGAVIMGLLWIIDVTGVFGLTWAVLGSTTTLAIALVAAVGAVLFWYDETSDENGVTA